MTRTESDIERGCQIAKRLKNELQIAQSSWAHFEAINGKTEFQRQQFRDGQKFLRCGNRGLIAAINRDTILALCRILDEGRRRNDCNLSQISRILADKKVSCELIKRGGDRLKRAGADPLLVAAEARIIKSKINLISDYVPNQWNPKSRPKKWMIHRIRYDILWPLRQKLLAHAADGSSIDNPTANQLRYAIRRIDTLVSATHHIFVGSPLDHRALQKLEDEANKFWDYAQLGFVEALKGDQGRIKSFNA